MATADARRGASSDADADADADASSPTPTARRRDGATPTRRARRDAMATDASNADDARGARRPSDDALARAYELLDARGRGYFTARDVRRVADANGFADWSDARVRAMVSAFKPEVERRVTRDGADESLFRMSRVEFERAVARAGARAPRA
jgi:hypothetical protein